MLLLWPPLMAKGGKRGGEAENGSNGFHLPSPQDTRRLMPIISFDPDCFMGARITLHRPVNRCSGTLTNCPETHN